MKASLPVELINTELYNSEFEKFTNIKIPIIKNNNTYYGGSYLIKYHLRHIRKFFKKNNMNNNYGFINIDNFFIDTFFSSLIRKFIKNYLFRKKIDYSKYKKLILNHYKESNIKLDKQIKFNLKSLKYY